MAKPQSFIDKFFRDSNGRIVIVQWPNAPLLFFFGAKLLAHVAKATAWRASFLIVAYLSLATWSLLEIFSGVNYFRRALGLVVLIICVTSAMHLVG